MTPSEKIEFVAQQVSDIRAGHTESMACPYCQGMSKKRKDFCCALMEKAVAAVLEHEQVFNEVKLQEAIASACTA